MALRATKKYIFYKGLSLWTFLTAKSETVGLCMLMKAIWMYIILHHFIEFCKKARYLLVRILDKLLLLSPTFKKLLPSVLKPSSPHANVQLPQRGIRNFLLVFYSLEKIWPIYPFLREGFHRKGIQAMRTLSSHQGKDGNKLEAGLGVWTGEREKWKKVSKEK